MNISRFRPVFALSCLLTLLWASASIAAPTYIPDALKTQGAAPDPNGNSWVLMDAGTGWLLAAKAPEKKVDPASLTKLMTAYIAFELLDKGQYMASDMVTISAKAWRAPGSRMFVKVGSRVSIGELLKGLVIQSGNDAAIALAEHFGGTEDGFVTMMNEKATALGLASTHYENSSGLPEKEHYTSAYDTAVLSRTIIQNYPGFYHLFSVKSYVYNDIEQPNRNRLLWRHDSYDGLKTGHTQAAGYCLAGSAARGNTRFIAVVMGSESKNARVQAVQSLVEYGFAKYESAVLLQGGEALQQRPLFKSQIDSAQIGAQQTVSALLPKGRLGELSQTYRLPSKLLAPLSAQASVGQVQLSFNDYELGVIDLYPLQDYPAGSLWAQLLGFIQFQLN